MCPYILLVIKFLHYFIEGYRYVIINTYSPYDQTHELQYVTMVNEKEIAKRLERIMTYYELTASAFAEAIDVQRSGISHILSGRNKPSLDFILKVVRAFPEVDLYWLLNGKGEFPDKMREKSEIASPLLKADRTGKRIERIILVYEDHSFEVLEPPSI